MKTRGEEGGCLRVVGPTKAYSGVARSTPLLTLIVITPFSWFPSAAGEVRWTQVKSAGRRLFALERLLCSFIVIPIFRKNAKPTLRCVPSFGVSASSP